MSLYPQFYRLALAGAHVLLNAATFAGAASVSVPPPCPRNGSPDTCAPLAQAAQHPSCGLYALNALARVVRTQGAKPASLAMLGSVGSDDTLADLERAAAAAGLPLKSVRRVRPGPWTVPSIMHWRTGHFSAVIARAGTRLLLDDPKVGGKVWCDTAWLDRHASGYGLVLAADLDAHWSPLSLEAAGSIQGGQRSYPPTPYDDDDEECPTDEEISSQPIDPEAPNPGEITPCPLPEACPPGHGEDGCDGRGMPVWRVSEPFVNLWVKDIPLYYTMSDGRIMPLVLRYKQRGSPVSTNVFGFGNAWECSWLSYFETSEDQRITFRVPGGGKRRYDGVTSGPVRGARGELVGSTVHDDGSVSYTVSYRSFCDNRYAQAFNGTETNTLHLLSEKADPHGRVIRFEYSASGAVIRLARVIDYDGKVSELSYTNLQFPRFVTAVRDPYGREARFQYDTNGNLIRIVDVAGITNAFRYSADGFLSAMMTPYGMTRFRTWSIETGLDAFPISRSIGVTLPNGERQAYAYHELLDDSCVPAYDSDCPRVDEEVPEPVTVGPLNQRSSFFWNSRQMALVTNDWPRFDPEHYRLARWRHWNMTITGGGPRLGTRLLLERAPSPDGIAQGHRRWYTYHYDALNDVHTVWLSQQAERLPDGTVRYVHWQRNEWGLPFAIDSTYSNGSEVGVRQTWLGYDGTDRRLTEVYGPECDQWLWPILTRSYAYNFRGQITNAVNALGESTTATYHPVNRQLVSVAYPFGLRITNRVASDGFLTQRVWTASSGAPLATNSFQWHQGRVRATVDARGLKVTHYWDALGRLTGRAYPDGTTISNWYAKPDGIPFTEGTGGLALLDRTRFKDRLGNLTTVSCDALRRPIAVTNALGHTTRYTWCDCGTVETITDPLGHTTSFEHDLDGRPVAIHLGNGPQLRIAYDCLGRPTNVADTISSLRTRLQPPGPAHDPRHPVQPHPESRVRRHGPAPRRGSPHRRTVRVRLRPARTPHLAHRTPQPRLGTARLLPRCPLAHQLHKPNRYQRPAAVLRRPRTAHTPDPGNPRWPVLPRSRHQPVRLHSRRRPHYPHRWAQARHPLDLRCLRTPAEEDQCGRTCCLDQCLRRQPPTRCPLDTRSIQSDPLRLRRSGTPHPGRFHIPNHRRSPFHLRRRRTPPNRHRRHRHHFLYLGSNRRSGERRRPVARRYPHLWTRHVIGPARTRPLTTRLSLLDPNLRL